MALTSWIRRQFKDGVTTTATVSSLTNAATSFSVGTGQGSTFPDGSVGPFIVTIDMNQAAEEKVLIQTRSGDTFTVATSPNNGRGYNGTTAQAHTNALVVHTIDAQDFDEANNTANQTLGAITASGDLLQGSGSHALARLARGTNGQFLQAGASSLAWGNALDLSAAGLQTTTGPVKVGGTLEATGAATLDSDLSVAGNETVTGNASITGNLTVTGIPHIVQPNCRVYRNAALTDANTVLTTCPFDSTSWDSATGFNATTHLYTVPTAGVYALAGAWQIVASSAAFVQLAGIQNGSVVSRGQESNWAAAQVLVSASYYDLVKCSANDTLGLQYIDGGGHAITTGSVFNYMSIVKVSD